MGREFACISLDFGQIGQESWLEHNCQLIIPELDDTDAVELRLDSLVRQNMTCDVLPDWTAAPGGLR